MGGDLGVVVGGWPEVAQGPTCTLACGGIFSLVDNPEGLVMGGGE